MTTSHGQGDFEKTFRWAVQVWQDQRGTFGTGSGTAGKIPANEWERPVHCSIQKIGSLETYLSRQRSQQKETRSRKHLQRPGQAAVWFAVDCCWRHGGAKLAHTTATDFSQQWRHPTLSCIGEGPYRGCADPPHRWCIKGPS